ncbi:hypothetical protein [Ureibacillus aquaedulcis]|uniref:HEPN domain-containing protein n=1 Tax=Ureibacillus aquaedulcis TaxID=3058421 RepID=A0ABT8GU26_9BACL|nr:hypothetical protein [Ureibacillus sp. BA0131]MDN4494922.1 hypothetical protein [Ureibacillus sp. BA0131]
MRKFKGFDDFKLITKLDTINDFAILFENTNDMYKKHYNDLVQLAESIEEKEAKQQFYDFTIDNFHLYKNTLPRISKYSILMNVWACLEYSLLQLANEAISELGIDDKVRGHSFKDYLSFLRMNVEETLVSSEKEEEIEVLRVIRNRLMHSNGFVNRDSQAKQHVEAIKYVESNDLLSFSEEDQIIISDYYVEECLDLASDIIEEIHNTIYKREK